MSVFYNVSTPDNIAPAICGRQRGTHLLHLVTEQCLPLKSHFLLHNLATVLTSNLCTTCNGIMDSVIKLQKNEKKNRNAFVRELVCLFASPVVFSLCCETHHRQSA